MRKTATLELHEPVIRRAREVARSMHGRLEDVLAGWLAEAAGHLDVCSFLFKRDSRAGRYGPHIAGNTPCLSFQTVAEVILRQPRLRRA